MITAFGRFRRRDIADIDVISIVPAGHIMAMHCCIERSATVGGHAAFRACSVILAIILTLGAPVGASAEIVFATEGDYPPWNERQTDGTLAGFDIDLVHAVCASLDETCEVVTATFPGMMDTLAAGGFDAIISGIAITAEREQKIAFTRPYMSLSVSFATAADSKLAGDAPGSGPGLLERLAAARIGAQAGTVNARLIESLLPDATLVTFGDQRALNQAVADGEVEAGLAATLTWRNPLPAAASAVAVIGPPFTSAEYPILGQGLGIGVAKNNDALKMSLDKAICDLTTDGTITGLSATWFDADLSVPCK
jgi:octopine/nopaline transport system substrate-binding protein